MATFTWAYLVQDDTKAVLVSTGETVTEAHVGDTIRFSSSVVIGSLYHDATITGYFRSDNTLTNVTPGAGYGFHKSAGTYDLTPAFLGLPSNSLQYTVTQADANNGSIVITTFVVTNQYQTYVTFTLPVAQDGDAIAK